eukprot:m.8000 g.8000  ORF g.8000 m.8000 type:complete len:314 (-) comp3815_c0_seq1:174-1115(-)
MRGLAIRKNVTYSARLIVQHRNQSNVATVGYEFPTRTDCVSHEKCLQLGATITQANMHLDTQVPPLFHYMAFQESVPLNKLGQDGHPDHGLGCEWRRMFGGSKITYNAHPQIGEKLRREHKIVDVKEKKGSSGELKLILHEYSYYSEIQPLFTEIQTIIYIRNKKATVKSAKPPSPQPSDEGRGATLLNTLRFDPVSLFRYSALTFNGHRIHYDHPYTTQVEGYPGLVVHGPLLATKLAEAALNVSQLKRNFLAEYTWRAVSPVFLSDSVGIYLKSFCKEHPEHDTLELEIRQDNGAVALAGTFKFIDAHQLS